MMTSFVSDWRQRGRPALLYALAVLSLMPSLAFAQTSAEPAAPVTAVNYPSVVLTDLSDVTPMEGHTYLVPDSSGNVTRSTLRDMVIRGYLMKYRTEMPLINLGSSGDAVWLVFPISSISSSENWSLRFGNLSQGRFGTLKQFDLYDLNRGKTLFTSMSDQGSILTIPESFHVNVPLGQTTYLAAYIKTAPANLTILSPRFENQSYLNPINFIQDNLFALLCGVVIIALLVMARTNRHIGYMYLAFAWGVVLFQTFLINSFIFQRILNADVLTPVTWASTFVLLIIASWKTIKPKGDKPTALYLGLSGILFIAGVAAIVLAKVMPNFALALEYGVPALIGFAITFLTFSHVSRDARYLCYAIGIVPALIGLSNLAILFLSSHFIPTNAYTIFIPQVLLMFGSLISFISMIDGNAGAENVQGKKSYTVIAPQKATAYTKDDSDYRDAREKSDHRRLMQVIEQERKAMSDMQIRAAQQTEEMRKAKESADEATRAKSAFLAVVSHEIRTPMTGIMGMLRLLQDTTLSKEQSEYTTTIKDSGDALLALLNDILDFEKIESGKMELESISFDLRRLVRGIHTLMKGHADFKNVELVLEVDPSAPTWVIGDPTRLRQVLLNLINNAIKFTSSGAVTLRIQDLTGKSAEGQNSYNIYFAVQDSGIGIKPDAQKKLFMPFAQADSSVSRKYGGTGLGLAICKRLIEAMGGNISISSKENEGSTFFFTLRMDKGYETVEEVQQDITHAAPVEANEEIFFNHQLKILVVDDNMINLKVVSGFLDKLGVDKATASNGKDVLDLVERENFTAILLDLQLPDMNGLEITKVIRESYNEHTARTPIIAFTGNTAQEDVETCHEAGMNDFAAKPISFEKIVELMKKADGQMDFRWPLSAQISSDEDDNISPLMRHSMSQDLSNETLAVSSPISLKEDFSDIDLSDDDDSFAVAVQKFEEMEKSGPPSVTGNLVEYGLDEGILRSLSSSLGKDATKEILVSFYEKSDELIAEIGRAFLDGNLPSLYARAHELKGMSANFGFAHLSQLCTSIEKAAKNSEPATAKDEIDGLGESYSIARSYLSKWLEEQT